MSIEQKQCLLRFLGYYNLQIDGIWGEGSKSATKKFQSDYGLTVDGDFGSETEKKILEVVANGEKQTVKEDGKDNDDVGGTFWSHIRHWSREEFRCRCGEYHAPYCNGFPVEPDQTLVELVDDIREHFGSTGIRSSGIRCKRHNADSGGVWNSKHMEGKALDFCIEGVSGEKVREYASADSRCNYSYVIKKGEPFVHVDVK